MYFSINYILSIITPIKQVWNGGGKNNRFKPSKYGKGNGADKKVS